MRRKSGWMFRSSVFRSIQVGTRYPLYLGTPPWYLVSRMVPGYQKSRRTQKRPTEPHTLPPPLHGPYQYRPYQVHHFVLICQALIVCLVSPKEYYFYNLGYPSSSHLSLPPLIILQFFLRATPPVRPTAENHSGRQKGAVSAPES